MHDICGIAGIFNLNGAPVSPVLLRKMTDAIAHRGPDGEGLYTDSFIGSGTDVLQLLIFHLVKIWINDSFLAV